MQWLARWAGYSETGVRFPVNTPPTFPHLYAAYHYYVYYYFPLPPAVMVVVVVAVLLLLLHCNLARKYIWKDDN